MLVNITFFIGACGQVDRIDKIDKLTSCRPLMNVYGKVVCLSAGHALAHIRMR